MAINKDSTYPDPFNKEHLDYMLSLCGGNREHLAQGLFWSFRFLITGGISGDYLEFGVGKGGTFATSLYFASLPLDRFGCSKYPPCLKDMRFFGFDSFEGLPEPYGLDKENTQSDFVKGAFAESLDAVSKKVARVADMGRVVFVPGWFEKTLTPETRKAHKIEKAALIHIDSDLYESAKLALEFVTPTIQDGTVLMFDDFFCNKGNPKMGERRAFAEWLKANPRISATEYRRYSTHGVSFILSI